MPVSYEQFMEATGAELVCGNIILGQLADRRKVGDIADDGTFNLNDDGKALLADIEAGAKPAAARRTKKQTTEAPAEETADSRLVDPT
jgi:hypothetical protein